MTLQRRVVRRPGPQPASYEPSPKEVIATKKFNQNLRYVQGFVTTVPIGGNTTTNINLNSPGKMLLGLSIIPITGNDLSNCAANLSVNNNVVLMNCNVLNLNPNYVGNLIFFPVPQPLGGNDTINLIVQNSSASQVTFYTNIFYVPR